MTLGRWCTAFALEYGVLISIDLKEFVNLLGSVEMLVSSALLNLM